MFICNQCGEKKSISIQNLPLFCTAVGFSCWKTRRWPKINPDRKQISLKGQRNHFFHDPLPPPTPEQGFLCLEQEQPLSFSLPLTHGSGTLFLGSKFSAIVQQTKTTSEWLKASVKPFQGLDKRLSVFLMMVNSSWYSKCWTTAVISHYSFSKPVFSSSLFSFFFFLISSLPACRCRNQVWISFRWFKWSHAKQSCLDPEWFSWRLAAVLCWAVQEEAYKFQYSCSLFYNSLIGKFVPIVLFLRSRFCFSCYLLFVLRPTNNHFTT